MNRKPWTDQDLQYLKEHYSDYTAAEIAQTIGRPIRSIYSKAKELRLKKSEEFLKSTKSGRLNGS